MQKILGSKCVVHNTDVLLEHEHLARNMTENVGYAGADF